MLRVFLALMLLALPATAEEVVLGLSKDKVAITTSFSGSEILIFGAVKRETPIPVGEPLEVVMTIAGPSRPVTVRRKTKRFGIWVNTDALEITEAPSFYAVASSAPLHLALNAQEDKKHNITIPKSIHAEGAGMSPWDVSEFSKAVIRIRSKSGAYQLLDNKVDMEQQTLFQTSIKLPSALTEGDYMTRIFLTRGGEIVSQYETSIDVRKVGLERWLYTLSRENAVLYGLMSLAIAIAAGWGASAIFRIFRA